MLGCHCNICFSPLMRNKNEEVFCVVCNIPYEIGEDNTVHVFGFLMK